MRASALGAVARVETHPLITVQAKQAMQMVKDSNLGLPKPIL
jgi:hypothetical protein